jgi:hypothetical protein
MKRKEKAIGEEIVKKYFNALNELKCLIESGKAVSIDAFERDWCLSSRTNKSLKTLGVIKIISGGGRTPRTYSWNDRIPVTVLLAKKVIKQNRVYQYGDMSNSRAKATTKSPVKRSTPNQYQTYNKVNDVGLIRRFLRWIY